MENQSGPAAEHGELCSLLRGSLDGRGFGGERIHVKVGLSPFTVHLKPSQHYSPAITLHTQEKVEKLINNRSPVSNLGLQMLPFVTT